MSKMSLVLRITKFLRVNPIKTLRCYYDDGHVRDMGGKWEERQKAFEEEYFNRMNRERLEKLKRKLKKKKKDETEDEDEKQKDEKREEEIKDDY